MPSHVAASQLRLVDMHCDLLQMKSKERPLVFPGELGAVCWVCGEQACVEVEIRNPTVIPVKVCCTCASLIRGAVESQWHSVTQHWRAGGALDAGSGVGWAPFCGTTGADDIVPGGVETQPSGYVAAPRDTSHQGAGFRLLQRL